MRLAFLILSGGKETTQAINIEGTLNAFRAAAEVGAKRFACASSVAAYGFHRDNPIGISEDWATQPADRFFYAQEKAKLEHAATPRPEPDDGIWLALESGWFRDVPSQRASSTETQHFTARGWPRSAQAARYRCLNKRS